MEVCVYCEIPNKPIYKYGGKSEPICEDCANFKGPPIKVEKVQGRNELCNCGSGKKFKKCCLLKIKNK